VDIFALLLACFILLLIERTVGDWVAEAVGAGPVAVLFLMIAVTGLAYMQSANGRGRANRFFAAAQARGYRTAYFRIDDAVIPNGLPHPGPAVAEGLPGRPTNSAPLLSTQTASQRTSTTASPAESGEPRAENVRLGPLRVVPDVALTDREVAFNVEVTASAGSLPDVEFSVNGNVVGRSRIVDQLATARWKTPVPGRYVVRVRIADGFVGTGSSAVLNILPGASRPGRTRPQ
jgi:hypothetical protein